MKRLIGLCALFLCACAPNYSNGERVGVVVKLSEKGFFFKSWEGELLVSTNNVQVAGDTFPFNVDPSALAKVKAAMESGKRVRLVYRQWAVSPVTIDNDHVVIDVKDADGAQ